MIGDGGNRSEADDLLDTSKKLLASSDFQGAKTFAISACKADPSKTHAADNILAISDTLLAVKDPESPNWYTILRLVHLSQNPELISIQYRRLSLLLNPKVNRLPFAEQALKLVSDAWCVLSDPYKKSVYDLELKLGQTHNESDKLHETPLENQDEVVDTRFWTACPYCLVLFEYPKRYEECTLRCECCKRAFEAVKTQTPPVECSEEGGYFCSWALFPLGCAKTFGWSPVSPLCVCPAQRSDQEVNMKTCDDGKIYVVISDDESEDGDDDMCVVTSDGDGDDATRK